MSRDGALPRRDKELARPNTKQYRDLVETFDRVHRGFQDQAKRADQILDYWDIYNCVLTGRQFYQGNSQLFVPIVRNAVNARKTRFLNQMFPASGRYIDATSTDGTVPHAIVALLEHNIRRAHLRTRVMAPLLRNGDIEGHYNLYVDWDRLERHTVSRETKSPQIEIPGLPMPADLGDEEDDETFVDMASDVFIDEGPCFEVLHDTDVLVLPGSADSIDAALMAGGEVVIIRRWTKTQLEGMIERGEVMRKAAETLLEMSTREDVVRSVGKELIDAAGIRGQGKIFQAYEMWKVQDTDEGRRLCRAYYGGYGLVLSDRRNPYWNDRCSLLSVPAEKQAGSFKGMSPIGAGIDTLQYNANDIANQAADSATYSMLPIIMTDPAKNPRTSTMILNLAAIWECDPNATRFAEFPKLWQDGIQLIQAATAQIFQTLGVNPAMLPQQTGRPGAKRNQAEIALEQTVDILTTSEACEVVEEGILTPAAEMMVDLDHQFREDAVTVRNFGEIGIAAKMESVPPQQTRTHYNFNWFGVEQARNAAQMQQGIAFLNVAATPAMQQALAKAGYAFNPAPILENAAGAIFGWRKGRQIIIDARSMLTVDPNIENEMLNQGFDVAVHPMDNPQIHLQSHIADLQAAGDPTGMVRVHIQRHMADMQLKAAAMMRGGVGGPAGQAPGGGAAPPQPGAQPQGPKLVRGPAGMINPDQMVRAGAAVMPRKT